MRTGFLGEILILDDGSKEFSAWREKIVAPLERDARIGAHMAEPDSPGVVARWNDAWRDAKKAGHDYLILSNNDVIFTPGWWQSLVKAFDSEDCGISGPMTNQPGHQEHQRIPINRPTAFLSHARDRSPTGNGGMVSFVNGFCFCIKMDRAVQFDDDHLFDPSKLNYEGEDEYQERMRACGRVAYIMDDALVYHFKDVSCESWREGRMGMSLETLPPRLGEDADFKAEKEKA